MTQILLDGLLQLGFLPDRAAELSEKYERYISEIVLFNSAYNLTNTSDRKELAVRHILDSIAPFAFFSELFKSFEDDILIGDIGSGGGFPGIPLALAFPDYSFCLVERMSKRCAFLENCTAILGLKNTIVLNKEVEKVDEKKFDVVTFRAFRPLDKKMTAQLLRITKTNGTLAAYKAKKDSITQEMSGIKDLVPSYEILPLTVPFLNNTERNLVVIKV